MKDKIPTIIASSKRVCLYGGAFDPIHKGHTFIAEKALEAFNLDTIIFIPTKLAPHKLATETSFQDRTAMVYLATEYCEKFSVSTIEETFADKSYTLNTVKALMTYNRNAEYYFLTGSDIFATIKTWFSYEKLLDLIQFIVVRRDTADGELSHLDSEILSRIKFLDIKTPDISSTALRSNIEGNSTYLDERVYQYILSHSLYNSNI